MTNDEAEKLARSVRPSEIASRVTLSGDNLRALCDHILSGDYKREIESAAFDLAAQTIDSAPLAMFEGSPGAAVKNRAWVRNSIRALITPAKTADTEG